MFPVTTSPSSLSQLPCYSFPVTTSLLHLPGYIFPVATYPLHLPCRNFSVTPSLLQHLSFTFSSSSFFTISSCVAVATVLNFSPCIIFYNGLRYDVVLTISWRWQAVFCALVQGVFAERRIPFCNTLGSLRRLWCAEAETRAFMRGVSCCCGY